MAAKLEDRDEMQEVENSPHHSDSALSVDDTAGEDQPVALDCSWSDSSRDSFTYFSGMVEPRNRINDTIVERLNCEIPLIENPADWIDRPGAALTYVDDFSLIESTCVSSGVHSISNKKTLITLSLHQGKVFFENVKQNANEIGLKVNGQKIQVLCTSPSIHRDLRATIQSEDGLTINSQSTLKQLGFF